MTDRQLKYLITLAEEGNMTAAAQKLFISQPSLSYLLGYVEKELGAELFNRNTTPLSLTAAGECYIEAARKILSMKREMENHISDITKEQQSTLQIGCGAQLSAILYPKVLPDFIRAYPNVTLKLVEDHFVNLCTQLLRGELDAFVANRLMEDGTVDSAFLYREEFGVVAPESWQLKFAVDSSHSYPVIDIDELRGLPFVLVKQGQSLRRNIDEVFEIYDIKPKIILETNNWETCYRMVAQNIGCTILPHTAQFFSVVPSGVNRYSLPGKHFRDVRIYWSKRGYRPESLEHFIALCQKRFADGTADGEN
ncbi:LysR family transcriptional regulator [Hominifimenecus sp. rT4P-3]|uniref:LysR family transcriptional regulator n=1 Tax=Hominifimenecus sp. rT4P-3 TaxID=3242979 RepID=UPI003DA47758